MKIHSLSDKSLNLNVLPKSLGCIEKHNERDYYNYARYIEGGKKI